MTRPSVNSPKDDLLREIRELYEAIRNTGHDDLRFLTCSQIAALRECIEAAQNILTDPTEY